MNHVATSTLNLSLVLGELNPPDEDDDVPGGDGEYVPDIFPAHNDAKN